MTEYQRFIAYLQEYGQDGIKNSAGHLRVELRQGKCRMTVKIRAKRMLGSCKLYFYIRKPDQMIGFQIGETNLVNGEAEFSFEADASNLAGKKETFEQVNGLLIFGNTKEYLAADWNNEDVTVAEAATINSKVHSQKATSINSKVDPTQEKGQNVSVENKAQNISEEKQETVKQVDSDIKTMEVQNPLPDFWSAAKDIVKGILKGEQEKEPLQQLASALRVGKNKETQSVTDPQKEESEISSTKSEISEVKVTEEAIETAATVEMVKEEKEELPKQPEIEESAKGQESSEKSDVQGTAIESLNSTTRPYCTNRRLPWQDAPEAREILDTGMKIYPFQDGELAECVRIEPRDIGRLPMEYWKLGNNSFLLHGYCNYKYLLFAKRMNRIRCEYLIMVPGIYQQKERMMARMFGFEQFKCARRREQRPGEFGYWYMTLIF